MGPLKGMKVIEIGGIGPGPFCSQMLSDMGAEVIRIERGAALGLPLDVKCETWHRGKHPLKIDIKREQGVECILKLIEQADALVEGFRPGVMENLGLGPDICFARNPKLVFGRMTGWGQDGPLSQAAGHDINYISLSGVLHAIGRPGEKPVPPLNLIGDFGGGGMMLAFGIVCGIFEASRSGKGQVVDASMVDGSAALMGMFFGLKAAGLISDNHGTNLLDGGAHFYDTYETSDGKWISLGSIEPQFYNLLLELAEIDDPAFKNQFDFAKWPEMKDKISAIFKAKTRDEWCKIMEGSDICFSPVLSSEEVVDHPHNISRKTFVEVDGVLQPAPAPRFSRTKPEIQFPPTTADENSPKVLLNWGFDKGEIDILIKDKII